MTGSPSVCNWSVVPTTSRPCCRWRRRWRLSGHGPTAGPRCPDVREVEIHDTLSKGSRALEPREPGRVGIYACGPTVYSRVHVGNARPFVVFALLKRFLEHEGYDVTLVENVTDVNDKIYDAARDAGVPSAELAERMTGAYLEDTDRLGLGRPDAEPKASETIGPIVELIGSLIESGHAYAAGGDVYFRVASFDGYGKLSNRPVEEMQQGEGDDAAELKESPQDFALWKATKEGEDTSWQAPWGEGRPGWHIECSAMAEEILGVDFEIHGGGSDLVFPHHENEIAQTEAARGQPLARIWLHNGMVQMGAEKMAKSVGNIRLLHGAVEQFGREAFLMWLAGGHYRQPLVYSEDASRTPAPRWSACATSGCGSTPTPLRRPSSTTTRSASSTPLRTTSTRRPPGPSCSTGYRRETGVSTRVSAWARGVCPRCCTPSASRASPRSRPARTRRPSGWRPSARRPGPAATTSAPTASATAWARWVSRCATPPTAHSSCAAIDRLRP